MANAEFSTLSVAQRERALTSRGWLARAPAEFQRALLSLAKWQLFEAGTAICHAADENADLTGIVRGVVEVSTRFSTADTPALHFLQQGQWFGMVPLISGQSRRLSATARTPVLLARVPHDSLATLLAKRPEWWRDIACSLLELTDIATNGFADLLLRDSERRCVAVLLRLSGCRFADSERDRSVEVQLTREELAAMSNVSRNTLGGILRRLARRGLVDLGYRTVAVRDPAALRAVVNQA
jgi:CRP-like cAMP-binding protein